MTHYGKKFFSDDDFNSFTPEFNPDIYNQVSQKVNDEMYAPFWRSISDCHFLMTKIQDGGMYCARVKSMLGKDNRYIFAIVNGDNAKPVGTKITFKDLKWSSLQFRTISGYIDNVDSIPNVTFNLRRDIPVSKYKTYRDDNNVLCSDYLCDFFTNPFRVTLVHTTDSEFEYFPNGNLLSSLNTWNTIIEFIEQSDIYKVRDEVNSFKQD